MGIYKTSFVVPCSTHMTQKCNNGHTNNTAIVGKTTKTIMMMMTPTLITMRNVFKMYKNNAILHKV